MAVIYPEGSAPLLVRHVATVGWPAAATAAAVAVAVTVVVVIRAAPAAGICEPVLMHDPVSLDSSGRPPTVEHEGFLHSDLDLVPTGRQHGLVRSCGLPVAGRGRPVRPRPVRVLAVPGAEEVPLLLSKARLAYINHDRSTTRKDKSSPTGSNKG